MEELQEIKIFICYASKDSAYVEQIKDYSLTFSDTQKITVWYDKNISLGDEWDDKIKKNLSEADIVLLFLSMDFFRSKYIDQIELKTALQRHANKQCIVIPIFVRYFLLDDYPDICQLQGYPKGSFFAELKEEKDRFYANLREAIKKVANDIRTNASLKTTTQKNKEEAVAVLQQETENPCILLAHSSSISGNMMKQLFQNEIEGEKKHNKTWNFEVADFIYGSPTHPGNSSIFTVYLIASEADISNAENSLSNNDINAKYKKSILWIAEPMLEDKIPTNLKTNKIVIGTMPCEVVNMVYLLEKERQESLRTNKDKFSQQITVYMLYDWNQDHNNDVRIELKEKLESRREIQTYFSPPPSLDHSTGFMQEQIDAIEKQLQVSKGAIIFYGTVGSNWYCYWQSEVQKITSLKSKAVCLADPEKVTKLKRDVSRSSFMVMENEDDLNNFINSLQK